MADERIDVTIRIDKDEARPIEEIVRDLTARGLERVETHARFKIVNGSADPDSLDLLRAVKGVASVRPDQTYKAQTR